jgi:hypothetical protein
VVAWLPGTGAVMTAFEPNSPTETFAYSRKSAALGYFEQMEQIVMCVRRAQSTLDRMPAIARLETVIEKGSIELSG